MSLKLSNTNILVFIASIFIIVVLVVLHIFGILGPVEGYFKAALSPMQSFFYDKTSGVSNFIGLITSIRDLEEENNKLQIKVQDLYVERAKMKELESENKILREQLGFVKENKEKLISAFIVERDPSNLFASFGIDKGKKDGVDVGMPVVVSDGILVGQIYEASDYNSTIIMTIDSRSKINAEIIDSGATGIVSGEHNLAIVMDLIPQNKVVKKGDLVTTSGLGEQFPKDLLIGEVENVSNADNELFQQARIKPLINFQDLKVVFIVKNS